MHLSSVHKTYDNRILYKECRSLADAGMEVFLVVPGERRERVEGVEIVPVKRARNRWWRNLVTTFLVWWKAFWLRPDIFHLHDPELLRVGALLARFGYEIVQDVHENPDDSFVWMQRPWQRIPRRLIAALSLRMRVRLGRRLSATVAATPRIASFYPAGSESETIVVRNYPRASGWTTDLSREKPNKVAYVGSIQRRRGAIEMLEAVASLDSSLDARFVLAGPVRGPGLLEEMEAHPGWARTEFLGLIDPPEVPRVVSSACIGLCVLHPAQNYLHEAYFTKLYEYMYAGIPIVASDFPAWRQQLEQTGCVEFVDPIDPAAIARAIDGLLREPERASHMGKLGREWVQENRCSWEDDAVALVDLYGRILDREQRSAQPS